MNTRNRERIVMSLVYFKKILRFTLEWGGIAKCGGLIIQTTHPTMGSSFSETPCALVAAQYEREFSLSTSLLRSLGYFPNDGRFLMKDYVKSMTRG